MAGEPFTSVLVWGRDQHKNIPDSNCTSLTLSAGIRDLDHKTFPELTTSTITVQGEAGTDWGQTWTVTAGAPVDQHVFMLEPGLVQIAASGASGLMLNGEVINGEVTCTTPDGHSS